MNKTQILAKFWPNEEVTYSLGWNFYQVSHKKTNNDGFYNDLDYQTNPDKPVIAVVGDSYVEAMQVDNNETFLNYYKKISLNITSIPLGQAERNYLPI